ncbi:uncharacterized protein LOC144908996 [Branchiostoma floridae x Branchiostoma belcheri]
MGMVHYSCLQSEDICDGLPEGSHDEVDCSQGLPYSCTGVYDWQCPGENTCLSGAKQVCNTRIECANGEDEKHCDDFCESIGGLRCECGQLTKCHLPKDRCDGRPMCYVPGSPYHCADDEENCEEYCNDNGGFFCGETNECRESHIVCDGHPDCTFFRFGGYIPPPDELGCDSCTGQQVSHEIATDIIGYENSYHHNYTCGLGTCHSWIYLCDDVNICGNWEDEQNCEAVSCHFGTCEATRKCSESHHICDGIPNCLDSSEEKYCDTTKCMDTLIGSSTYKEISSSQYCDGREDCRTGVDESPRRCAMFTDRLPCTQTNRFFSSNSLCDGVPDCSDASDEDACIGIGACIIPIPLLLESYSLDEGIGNAGSHSTYRRNGLFLTQWEVEDQNDWLQITLEGAVQLTAVVVSGSKSDHPLAFTLKYGLGTACLTAYTDGNRIKIFQTSLDRSGEELPLAIAVHAKVVKLIPYSWLKTAVMDIGLLGCPIKEQRLKDMSCGKGWTMFEDRCYQKFSSPLVWWAAERYCQALGGHLAAVNTLQENEFLNSNIGNGWIGMKLDAVIFKKQKQKMATFTWSDGSPAGNTFWEQNISHTGFQEYMWRFNDPLCAFLEDHGPWSLQACSLIEKEFICEKGLIFHSYICLPT